MLEDERRKCEKLKQMNSNLKEQLEDAQQTNESLTSDLQKITNDWENLREELMLKEDEWKDEEHAFHEYYNMEHNRLLNLWREVVGVKRLFAEVQTNTERELSKMKDDVACTTRDLARACSGITATAALTAQSEVHECVIICIGISLTLPYVPGEACSAG